MKKGNIFLGVLLLSLGVLFILRNLNVFYFNIHSLLKLWPLLLVFIGISMLPVKQGIKLILVGISILIGIIILSLNPYSNRSWSFWDFDRHYDYTEPDDYSYDRQNITEDYDSTVYFGQLNLKAAAGKIFIQNQTDDLFMLKSEGESGLYSVHTNHSDSLAIIDVRQKNKYKGKNLTNTLHLSLNREPVWDFNIDVGAAALNLDVSSFKVEKIDINGGASKIDLKIGSMAKLTRVNIEAGASSIYIEIPFESACELSTNTVLSSRNIDGFNNISDKTYQTPNFSDSVNQIIIDVDAAVSSFTIKRI